MYKDATNGRDIVTASYPLYDSSEELIGVAGIDVDMETF